MPCTLCNWSANRTDGNAVCGIRLEYRDSGTIVRQNEVTRVNHSRNLASSEYYNFLHIAPPEP
jgi:hypothetical protein